LSFLFFELLIAATKYLLINMRPPCAYQDDSVFTFKPGNQLLLRFATTLSDRVGTENINLSWNDCVVNCYAM
jgi:hypothetical protein